MQIYILQVQIRAYFRVNEKYYVVDHGLREAIVGANLQNIEIILENIVGLELLRRGYKVYVGRVGEKEIYLLNEESTIAREFGSLLEVKDNYPKFVLYKESTFMGNHEGILAVKIEDWLLNS